MSSSRLQEAIRLIKSGNRNSARQILEVLIREDEHNVSAWLWYIDTLEGDKQRFEALTACHRSNPNNEQVMQAQALFEKQQDPPGGSSKIDGQVLVDGEPVDGYLDESVQTGLVLQSAEPDFRQVESNAAQMGGATGLAMPEAQLTQSRKKSSFACGGCGCLGLISLISVVLLIGWFLIWPGVFTIQPIGALPQGITFVYYGRSSQMPFFSSPDGLCLKAQGSVSLLCRAAAIGAAGNLTDRIIVRLPYSRWAYLASTGGVEFEK